MTQTLTLPAPPGGIAIFLEQLIERLADLVAARIGTGGGSTKRLMTISEAAEYIGRSRRAVEAMIARGTIPVTKLDGRCQIDRVALDKMISDRTYFDT
jgi:excisionase family DNA binding protein